MSRYEQEQPTMQQGGRPNVDTVRVAVHDMLQRYLDDTKQSAFPSPMPPDIGHCVDWWLKTMQEPERPTERPQRLSVAGRDNTSRWEYSYLTRVTTTLRKFLHIPIRGKELIVRGREDGVYWRGEDGKTFIAIVDETIKMRKDGVDRYAKGIAPGLRRLQQQRRRKQQGRAA